MKPTKSTMRINNKRIIPYIDNLHVLLLLALSVAIVMIFMPISIIVKHVSPYFLVGIIIIAIFLIYKLGDQHFEYDSDGEVINVRTQNAFWVKYFPSQKTIMDFPKNKLVSFKIINSFPKKTLELYVSSKRSQNGITKLKFNITYLTFNEIEMLKKSLNKIIKTNQELKESQVVHAE